VARLSDRVVTGAPNGVLANDEPIQWYAADGITLIDGIKVDAAGAVYLAPAGGPTEVGGALDVTGNTQIDGTLTVPTIKSATSIQQGDSTYNAGASDNVYMGGAGDNVALSVSHGTTTNLNCILFYNGNGQVGSINTNGTATAYNTSSDPRLKSDFTPITGASEMILEAREQGMIGEFTFLSDPTQTVWGYNAHKLIDAQPNFGGAEGEGSRDAPLGDDVIPAGVDASKRVPILEAAIGELLDRIRVLEEAGVK
jgi:hypothetical protein